ncbi:MAG: hypothetical protein CM15mP106_7880 [Candidatus Neomarinimicrobiota bacterium]|nr:MAG: hypothetical protein CM15mP106_7880 [Candidatus Neomarinimicrobiota bacterium]
MVCRHGSADYIEFDFSDEMIVDSVWFNNEGISFDHIDDIIKIPAQASIPEGYNFSCQIFYHGSPPTSGFGSYNFDMHNNIDQYGHYPNHMVLEIGGHVKMILPIKQIPLISLLLFLLSKSLYLMVF